MGQLALKNPVIVARSNATVLLASVDNWDAVGADAQTWRPDVGYSEVKPLQVWFKFLYYLEEVLPPTAWQEPGDA